MCFPMAGALFSAAGSIFSAVQQNAAAKQQSKALKQQATTERQIAASKARQIRRQGDRLAGTQRAGFLQSGVAIEGSAVDVITDSAREVELDAGRVQYGAEINAVNLETEARNKRIAGRNQLVGGILGSLAPILDSSPGRAFVSSGFS